MKIASSCSITLVIGTMVGCAGSGSSALSGIGGNDASGGVTAVAGAADRASGGSVTASGGTSVLATGGTTSPNIAGAPTGGTKPTGGSTSTLGSTVPSGGFQATGGKAATGGVPGTGGYLATGGLTATGGRAPTGGVASTGGSASLVTGGSKSTGGVSTTGATTATTGGTTSTSSTNQGGATAFNPCPSGTACKILPLGDSITYGLMSSDGGGYREPLFKLAVADNRKITFTGSQTNGPSTVTVNGTSVSFPKNNEGHSGWTIDQIAGLVPSPAMSTIPNIVLLMAGTNDVYASSGQSTMNARLGSLIDKVIAAAPNALLVVATLTPLSNTSWNSTANTYDGQIPAVVQARVSQGKHVLLVDMSKMPVSQLSDGIHPNDSGYAYMANTWYAAIKAVLPN